MPLLDRVVLPAKLEKITCYLLRILSYRIRDIKVFLILSLALASYLRQAYFAPLFNTTKPDLT